VLALGTLGTLGTFGTSGTFEVMTDHNNDPTETETPEPAADQAVSAGEGVTPPEENPEAAALRRERDEMYDRLLRKTAEFDNYRKRIDKERRELSEWAAAEVLTDMLNVLDNLDRALAAEAPPEAQGYRAGVELIHRQIGEILRKRGVTALETLGGDFDPHVHQAVAYEETPGAREGEIVGELRKGYRLGDRLLRPALVRVAKAS
jgi:molecular chaperone GrpE